MPKTPSRALTVQLSYLNRWAFFLVAALLSRDRHSRGHVHADTHAQREMRRQRERQERHVSKTRAHRTQSKAGW